MMIKMQNTFKHYINSLTQKDDNRFSKTRKKVNKKAWRGRWYGGLGDNISGMNAGDGMVGECLRAWREVNSSYEEEQEENLDIRDVSQEGDLDTDALNNEVPELGDNNPELDDGIDNQEDPDRQGVIRTVKNAHLVYKRGQEDGTFEELWIYSISDNNIHDEVDIRRDILAGTDIPAKGIQTSDGQQRYEIWTAGNAQLIKIRGLPN